MSSSTVASSSSIPSFYTMDGTPRMNGTEFASGLDTQNLIKALTADIASKIDKQKQLEQKDEWKRDAFHSLEDLLQKFSDTYFSYSTSTATNIMSRAFFDSEALTSSNSSIVTATGAQSDAGNVVIDSITQLASAACYTGNDVSKTSIQSTEALGSTISSASYLNLNVDGTAYTLSLGAGIDTAGKDADEIATDLAAQLKASAQTINDAIKTKTGEEGKVSFSASEGNIALTGATITGASANLAKGLGTLETDTGTYNMSNMKVQDGSAAKLASLSDQLSGTTLTVQLDGLTKTVTFDSSDSSLYGNAHDVASYLQTKLNSTFGSGKISVSNGSKGLTIQTSSSDPTSVLTFSSASAGVLGTDNLLHIRAGESNRLETDKTLDELDKTSELKTTLASGTITEKGSNVAGYKFVVNGKEFSFDKNTELNTVINDINNDTTANVTVSYSQTLNKFRIVSDDTGSQGKVDFYDETGGGNLAAALFGKSTVLRSSDISTAPASDTAASYSISWNGGAAQPITITRKQSGQSVSDFAAAVQSAVNGKITPKGTVMVGVSADGKSLTFQTAAGTTLNIAEGSGSASDILGFGTGGQVSSKVASGSDLSMNVNLGGGTQQTITRSTNSFTLDGITMNINGTTKTDDAPIKFTPGNGTDDLYKKVSDFVDQYNAIIDKVNTDVTQMPLTQSTKNGGGTVYDPLTDDQKKTMTDTEITEWNKKAQQGLLFCDPQISALQSDIRTAMESSVDSVDMSLASIGISTAAYDTTSGGKLVIDKTALTNALKSEPDKVAQLFTNSDGIASRVKKILKRNIGEFGNSGTLYNVAGSSTMMGADNSEIGNEITEYNSRIKDLQTNLKDKQNELQTKFTNMEAIISRLSDQFNYISSMSNS